MYDLERVVSQHDETDLGATGEGLALDVCNLVVGKNNRGDILQSGEREFTDVAERGVLDRETLELLKTPEREGFYVTDVVAVEEELLQGAQVGECVLTYRVEHVLRQGQLLEVVGQANGYLPEAARVTVDL